MNFQRPRHDVTLPKSEEEKSTGHNKLERRSVSRLSGEELIIDADRKFGDNIGRV